MALNAKALTANPVYSVPFGSSRRWRSWVIKNIQTVVGFLPVLNLKCREHFVGDDVSSTKELGTGSTVDM